MIYVTGGILALWAIYSWQIALTLIVICWLISIFYCGAISGEAQTKAIKTFCAIVIVMSLIMLGAVRSDSPDGDSDAVKYCNAQAC